MKIMDNGIVRNMTAEEEAAFINASNKAEASSEDYEQALQQMGVDFSD